jgi:hypothetical protein
MGSREREQGTLLERQISRAVPELVREAHVLEYFALRNQDKNFDLALDLIRSAALEAGSGGLDLAQAAGVLEAFIDWNRYRPEEKNPLQDLALASSQFIRSHITRIRDDKVFVFQNEMVDSLLNMRLGKTLLDYAEQAGDQGMEGVARSLILSILSTANSSGIAASLVLGEDGYITSAADSSRVDSARIYRILGLGDFLPRFLALEGPEKSRRTWTTAQSLSSVFENNILDITVSFPPQETHYMLISGLPQFVKLQLYGMDFRTDPQFEQYDSSGWVYTASEQTLALKMKHRSQVEHISIFFNPPARPAPQPAQAPPQTGVPAAPVLQTATETPEAGIPASSESAASYPVVPQSQPSLPLNPFTLPNPVLPLGYP